MLLETAALFLHKAWDMLGLFLPFFILIAIFQLSFTLFTTSKLIGPKKPHRVDGSFIKKLINFNNSVSGSAMTLAIIGTVYGLLLALTHLAAGWAENNQLAVINTMQGASIALSSTLGGLVIARLWGLDINDGLIDQLCMKYNISRGENESDLTNTLLKEQIEESKTISTHLEILTGKMDSFTQNQERVEESLLCILESLQISIQSHQKNGAQHNLKKSTVTRLEREPDDTILEDIAD